MDPMFGIDPALLAPPGQLPASPTDPLAAAIQALQASGATFGPPVPSLYGTGAADTNLEPLPQRPRVIDTEPSQPTGQYDAGGHQLHGVQLPPSSVTVTGQQAMPSQADAAARTHQEQIADPSVQLAPGDVQGQSAREQLALNDAGDAQREAARLEVQAATDKQNRIADADKQYADQVGQANQSYQVGRQAAEAKADADTGAWLQQYMAMSQKEPNPTRWWDNQSAFGKAMWGLSLLFSAGHVALTPGAENTALNMVQQNIKDDMGEQRARLQRTLDAMRLKGATLDKQNARNLTDMTDDHSMELGRLNALRQAYLSRAQAPGAVDLQAGMAKADVWFAEKTLGVATSKRETAVQMDEARLQREHASSMAAAQRQLSWNMQSREIAKDYDLAKIQADASAAKGAKEADPRKGFLRISPEAGALVLDKRTKKPVGDPGDEGALWVPAKEHDKVQALVSSASQEAENLMILKRAFQDSSSLGLTFGADPKVNAALASVQLARVKGQGGLSKTTDKDMDIINKEVTGFGNAGVSDRFLVGTHRADAIASIQTMIDSQKTEMDTALSPYSQPGAVIDWSPRAGTPVAAPRSPDRDIAELGGAAPLRKVPSSPQELQDARAHHLDPQLTTSAGAGRYAPTLDRLQAGIQGATADHIRALAEGALKTVHGDAWSEDVTKQPDAGSPYAEKAFIPDLVEPAIKDAEKRERQLVQSMKDRAIGRALTTGEDVKEPTAEEIRSYASTEFGFSNLSPDDPDRIRAEVIDALNSVRSHPWWRGRK